MQQVREIAHRRAARHRRSIARRRAACAAPPRGLDGALRDRQLDLDGRQHLADFVVQLAGDAAALLFLRCEELATTAAGDRARSATSLSRCRRIAVFEAAGVEVASSAIPRLAARARPRLCQTDAAWRGRRRRSRSAAARTRCGSAPAPVPRRECTSSRFGMICVRGRCARRRPAAAVGRQHLQHAFAESRRSRGAGARRARFAGKSSTGTYCCERLVDGAVGFLRAGLDRQPRSSGRDRAARPARTPTPAAPGRGRSRAAPARACSGR